MKKTLSIFIIIIGTSLYASNHQPSPRGWRPCPPIINRICRKSILEESRSGFDTAYRKDLGNQYFEEAFRSPQQKRTAGKKNNVKHQQQLESLYQRHSPFSVPLQPTAPSFTHLRTPRNTEEIKDPLIIRSIIPSMFPEIARRTARITQSDIQPIGSYFYKK